MRARKEPMPTKKKTSKKRRLLTAALTGPGAHLASRPAVRRTAKKAVRVAKRSVEETLQGRGEVLRAHPSVLRKKTARKKR